MSIDDDKLIDLLEQKINQIDLLTKSYQKDALRQWKTEVSIILDAVIGSETKYYKQFEQIHYAPITFFEDATEADYNAANTNGLNEAKSILQAIIFGKKNQIF